MSDTTVHIMYAGYNQRTGAILDGYNNGDKFDWLFCDFFEPSENLGLECERMYRMLNQEDRSKIYTLTGLTTDMSDKRSMSVGDAVVFVRMTVSDNDEATETVLGAYACEPLGWEAHRAIAADWKG